MNERERERSATIYYDAQEKFGTPVNEEGVDEVYVSQQRRTYSFQRRDAPATGVSSVIQSMRRLPNSAAPVTMPPSQPDYDYPSPSKGHSAALARLSASPSSQHRQKPIVDYEDFVPGNNRGKPSSSSLAAFKRQNSGEVMELSYSRRGAASGDLPPPHPSHGGAYQQHHPPRPKDFPVVVGSYGNDREKADISFTRRNSGEQRRRDEESYLRYGSPPQLNVNQHQNPQGPQFYHGFRETKANSQGQRFGSSGSASRHLYEEVPTSAPYESSARETDILGDDDLGHGHQHVPVLFKPQQNPNRSRLEPEEVDSDGHSGVYQPGKYQPFILFIFELLVTVVITSKLQITVGVLF
ncbi:unnamed protein product [Caenorhabditis auriculariae]|uniref:Uncharacterized protein n=1 Tax=Caenorhabditis auriculariae TaxID=2777116 RepID=A0A8S1H523_9PELO|nr:unnamed protein product [Caenorhabditis auriculariae]